jgi:hypothetical protein
MIVHSDSFAGVISILLIMLGTALALSASVVLLLAAKFHLAAKVLRVTGGVLVVFWLLQAIAIRLTPQTVVNRGDSFCYDIWCIGVTSVTPSAGTGNAVYKVDVHIFSDAGSGGKIHGKMNVFLVDDHGRRFPLLPDPSVTPFTRELAPQEGIDTTLTFQATPDSKHLYLISEPNQPHTWIVRLFTGDWLAQYFAPMRKPALLRVL